MAEYTAALGRSIDTAVASAQASKGSFFLGIPAAASCHEFESYTKADGTVVKGAARQLDFAKAALDTIAAKGLADSPHFLGPALWGFAEHMAYPPQSANYFTPSSPFVDAGEQAYLAAAL